MTRYSTTILCACGCGEFARVHGKYHSDECCRRDWNRKRLEIGRVDLEIPKQKPIELPRRPESGDRCACCGAVLYAYEKHLGSCMRCTRKRIIHARETVPVF